MPLETVINVIPVVLLTIRVKNVNKLPFHKKNNSMLPLTSAASLRASLISHPKSQLECHCFCLESLWFLVDQNLIKGLLIVFSVPFRKLIQLDCYTLYNFVCYETIEMVIGDFTLQLSACACLIHCV